jgi:hypothetical protein
MAVRDPRKPGRYVLGIECDGAAYHSSVVARDRDRLRQEVLEGLGWRLHRIWGPSWYRDRARELHRLDAAIQSAISGPTPPSTPATQTPDPGVIVEELEDVVAPWAGAYVPFVPVLRDPPPLDDPSCVAALHSALVGIVTALAPVHSDTCVDTVRDAWQVDRMGARRRARVEQSLAALEEHGAIVRDRHGFYWAPGEQTVVVRGADPEWPGSVRKPALVSPDEAKLAIFYSVQDARSISEDDLFRRVARIFGWGRLGVDITSLLSRCREELLQNGDLTAVSTGGVTVLQAKTEVEPDLS